VLGDSSQPGSGGDAGNAAGGRQDYGCCRAGFGGGGGVSTGGTGSGGYAGANWMIPKPDPTPTAPAALESCATAQPERHGDGWIVFDSDRQDFNRDIYRVRPDGTDLELLTGYAGSEREPAFAPDGASIAFVKGADADAGLQDQVWLMDLATREIQQVTQRPEGADQPSFSRDGTLLTFHSGASVYTINLDGSDERLIGTGLDTFNTYAWPHFSADDSEIVFDRNNEIDAIRRSDGEFRYIVQNWTTTIESPAVSSNGLDVAYHASCNSVAPYHVSVWTTPFGTTTEPCQGRRVTPLSEPDAERPTWGPGNRIAYERVDRDTNVATIALVSRELGSVPCDVTPSNADNRNPSWLPIDTSSSPD
jgi:dipeptidyl aminopeptidase/acylaminoacyl peptidase